MEARQALRNLHFSLSIPPGSASSPSLMPRALRRLRVILFKSGAAVNLFLADPVTLPGNPSIMGARFGLIYTGLRWRRAVSSPFKAFIRKTL